MLINLYILSLVLGASLLAAALFLGDQRRDDPADRVPLMDDPSRPSQIGQLEGVSAHGFFSRMLRSRRFWTFFVCFFGMTGLVLDGLDLLSPLAAFAVAVGVGAISGAGISSAVRIGSSSR
ncbi:MAG: hypothetical protein PVI24_00535 [Myxococcales bacterium]|jgi:hypothetical protein